MRLVAEAVGVGDLRQRLVGGQHHLPGRLDALACHIGQWRDAEGLFEHMGKMAAAQFELGSQVAGANGCGQVVADVLVQASRLPACQTGCAMTNATLLAGVDLS